VNLLSKPFCLIAVLCASSGYCARAWAQDDGFHPNFGLEKRSNQSDQSGNPKPAQDKLGKLENWDGSKKNEVKVAQDRTLLKFKMQIFTKHRNEFKAICNGVKQDGRLEVFYSMLDLNSYKDEKCVACRPFLQTFASQCKPPVQREPHETKKPKEAEATKAPEEGAAEPPAEEAPSEPTATPLPVPTSISKAREPNLAVLDAVSGVFSKMADENKEAPELEDVLKAINRYTAVLLAPEGKTKAEQEYFDIVAEYSNRPFEALQKSLEKKKSAQPEFDSGPSKQKKLEDLFNF